jgi:dTDP-4-dehydrorhamnose reductase
MSRWLVTGAGGMLGRELLDVLAGEDVVAATRSELDVCDAAAVAVAVKGVDIVLNAAAYTNVDGAETDESAAFAANAEGPANLAYAAREAGARLITVSTDYVFAGDAIAPYAEDDPTAPATAYGRTKLAGELAVRREYPEGSFVVRTAWLYGRYGANFVATMLRLEAERPTLEVVNDQRGQPTWARDLAIRLVGLGRTEAAPGIYHLTGAGEATWFDLARAVFAGVGADPERVQPTTTDRFSRPAPRPAYSVLSDARWRAARLEPMLPWRDSLTAALPALQEGHR